MLRRAFIAAFLLTLAFGAGAPAQALAHDRQMHVVQVEPVTSGDVSSALAGRHEAKAAAASIYSYSAPVDSGSSDDCHCPACHGCGHAPALSDVGAGFAPVLARSHAAPSDGGWLMRRWRSAIENPPKAFA